MGLTPRTPGPRGPPTNRSDPEYPDPRTPKSVSHPRTPRPKEGTLAHPGVEGFLDPLERNSVGGDALRRGVVGDEVVLAPYDLTGPGQVGEHGIIRLDPGESGFDHIQDGFVSGLTVSETSDILGRELALVGTKQLRHFPHVVGNGGQLANRRRVVADADDQGFLSACPGSGF